MTTVNGDPSYNVDLGTTGGSGGVFTVQDNSSGSPTTVFSVYDTGNVHVTGTVMRPFDAVALGRVSGSGTLLKLLDGGTTKFKFDSVTSGAQIKAGQTSDAIGLHGDTANLHTFNADGTIAGFYTSDGQVLSVEYPSGGGTVEVNTYNTSDALRMRGNTVDLHTFNADGTIAGFYTSDGQVLSVEYPSGGGTVEVNTYNTTDVLRMRGNTVDIYARNTSTTEAATFTTDEGTILFIDRGVDSEGALTYTAISAPTGVPLEVFGYPVRIANTADTTYIASFIQHGVGEVLKIQHSTGTPNQAEVETVLTSDDLGLFGNVVNVNTYNSSGVIASFSSSGGDGLSVEWDVSSDPDRAKISTEGSLALEFYKSTQAAYTLQFVNGSTAKVITELDPSGIWHYCDDSGNEQATLDPADANVSLSLGLTTGKRGAVEVLSNTDSGIPGYVSLAPQGTSGATIYLFTWYDSGTTTLYADKTPPGSTLSGTETAILSY